MMNIDTYGVVREEAARQLVFLHFLPQQFDGHFMPFRHVFIRGTLNQLIVFIDVFPSFIELTNELKCEV